MTASTAPAGPVFRDAYPSARFSQAALYPPPGLRRQSTEDFVLRTDRADARASLSRPPPLRPSYSPVPPRAAAGPGPSMPAEQLLDAYAPPGRPALPNRARRPSNASNVSVSSTGSSAASRESLESRRRSSSRSSQTSFESFYSAHSSPSYPAPGRGYHPYGFQRPAPLKQLRRRAPPGELFAALPGEVLELILEELRRAHLAPGSASCATCWMRDACSMAVSARKMLPYARAALYGDVQLVGADAPHQRKRYKPVAATRLALLRKTLRTKPALAAMVRSLKVPAAAPPGMERDAYHDAVASLVMACPNLERVVGFHPGYDHSFTRFSHALATRSRLQEASWVLEPSRFQRQHRIHAVEGGRRHHIAPGDLQPEQSARFADLHGRWQSLSTLTIHCRPGATLSPAGLLVDAVAGLPALQNLHLDGLPRTAFHDGSLPSLPALKKLTLSRVAGITSAGLSAFATHSPSGRTLESLTLVHLGLDSLPALARTLSNLGRLVSLALVQSHPPVLPLDDPIVLFPYLASPSLRRLHWDVPTYPTAANAADHILARSVAAGGFPALRRLRAPADPEGLFQSLCRPQEKADLPGDRYRGGVARHHGAGAGGPGHGHGSRPSTSSATSAAPPSPTQLAFFLQNGYSGADGTGPKEHSDLHLARLAAQGRLEAARARGRFLVNVINEDGVVVEQYGLAGFIGTVASPITYHLLPDAGGEDEQGGLVGVEEALLGDGGEDLLPSAPSTAAATGGGKEWKAGGKGDAEAVRTREGCSGRWNAGGLDKKDKERWFHTERGRWRGVMLS